MATTPDTTTSTTVDPVVVFRDGFTYGQPLHVIVDVVVEDGTAWAVTQCGQQLADSWYGIPRSDPSLHLTTEHPATWHPWSMGCDLCIARYTDEHPVTWAQLIDAARPSAADDYLD